MLKLFLMVLLYYPLSLTLTFYQKWYIKNYRFPLAVVSGHYLTKFSLALLVRTTVELFQRQRRVRISFHEQLMWLMPIGFCSSLDIGLSNWSLEYVTVSLYTMAKSSSILFIVLFSLLLKLERWRPSLGVATIFIASGLFLFTWQYDQLNYRGLMLVELAAFCTGIRWTCSQLIMQSEELTQTPLKHPLDMIVHVQPWMLVAILPIMVVIEGPDLDISVLSFQDQFQPLLVVTLIFIGGALAFLMEFTEYMLLVNTSGITLSIIGIIKECITLLLAHYLNGDNLTPTNIVGLFICIIGMLIHSLTKRTPKTTLRMESLYSPSRKQDQNLLLYEQTA